MPSLARDLVQVCARRVQTPLGGGAALAQGSGMARALLLSFSLATLASLAGCSERIEVTRAPLGGTCLACHEGITDAHGAFALSCADCHGGDDDAPAVRSALAAQAQRAGETSAALGGVARLDDARLRDQRLMKASHVLPLDATSWPANGIDDDDDGRVDEAGESFDGRLGAGGPALGEGALAPSKQWDSEINRDLDYLRFLNPGDLRVAQVSCGGSNKNANAAMVCHAAVVHDVRRSMMANNPAVPAGATYGNAQLPRAIDYGAAFAESEAGRAFDERDPRIGRVGYTYDYDAIDAAYLPAANAFDREALLEKARANADPDDDDRMAFAGALLSGRASAGDAVSAPPAGLTRFGNTLAFPDRAVDVLQPIGNPAFRAWPQRGSALEARIGRVLALDDDTVAAKGITNGFDGKALTNPVDAALRHFRPYQTLNVPGTNDNFGAVDFSTSPVEGSAPPPDPTDIQLAQQNNPFGRGRPSGCSACHVTYAKDGRNREPVDRTVTDNGRAPSLDLPFGMRPDLGERFYAERHKLERTVPMERCASCHGFVTRVDLAYSGATENEGDLTNGPENIVKLSPVTFTTPRGSQVNIVDNLARWQNGSLVNAGERVSEDENHNGELDPGEDTDGDGALTLPDRDPRSESFDGRQPRVVYGGANGSTRLADVHFLAGMQCVDCHSEQDVHGDGNTYTRNWDAIEIECDDCHGTPSAPTTLRTTGPNGGTDLSRITTAFGSPWLERDGDDVVQHSRTKREVSWVVPQLVDEADDGAAAYAHRQPLESAPARADEARRFAHVQESGKKGGLECYACHSSWQPNCLDCHMKIDVAKPVQEQWYSARDGEDVFFQLFSFVRSPFLLGRAGDVEGNKVGPWRATQEVFVTVTAGDDTLADSVTFSTQRKLSSLASNPYFPHTVRTAETKSCARCHTLVDDRERIANDHLLAEAQGEGTGRYDLALDWAFLATSDGLALVDTKREAKAGSRVQFPGFDHEAGAEGSARAPRTASLSLPPANDVALLRGVSFASGSGAVTDVALVCHDEGLTVVDVFGRDDPDLPPFALAQAALGPCVSVDVLDGAASQSARAVVLLRDQLVVVDFRAALEPARVREILASGAGADLADDGIRIVGALPLGVTSPTKVRLRGRDALVAHDGGVTIVALDDADTGVAVDPGAPLAAVHELATDVPALDVVARGRFAFVAAGSAGVHVFDLASCAASAHASTTGAAASANDGASPCEPVSRVHIGVTDDARGVALWGSRLLVANGAQGLAVVDVTVPADPVVERATVSAPIESARAVVVSATPVRSYALVLDGAGGALVAVDLTPAVDQRASADRASRGARLSLERQDPLTPFDARNASPRTVVFPLAFAPRALARGVSLDRLQDGDGNALRDTWSIGAAPLERTLIERMRAVVVREVPGTTDTRGDGLGCVVRVGDDPSTAGCDTTPQ